MENTGQKRNDRKGQTICSYEYRKKKKEKRSEGKLMLKFDLTWKGKE